jgi:hypothetical protein
MKRSLHHELQLELAVGRHTQSPRQLIDWTHAQIAGAAVAILRYCQGGQRMPRKDCAKARLGYCGEPEVPHVVWRRHLPRKGEQYVVASNFVYCEPHHLRNRPAISMRFAVEFAITINYCEIGTWHVMFSKTHLGRV